MKSSLPSLSGFVRKAFTTPIVVWSRWVSPATPRRCRYEPTCSSYALAAIEELGILRGSVLSAWRILRCNPFSPGGVDRVEDRTLFRGSCCQHDEQAVQGL